MRITKRDVILAAHCPRLAWLSKRQPLPRSEAENERGKMGVRLGELARTLFPGGVLLPYGGEGVTATAEAVAGDAEVLFEASFQVGDWFARVDVLHRLEFGWRLIEFKSSKEPKEEHFADAFFQVQVLQAAGLQIEDVCLGLISSDYVYQGGEIVAEELFRIVSIAAEAARWLEPVAMGTTIAEVALASDSLPAAVLDRKCYKPGVCAYFDQCHPDAPGPSIYTIPNLHKSKEEMLVTFGIRTVVEIETDELLNTNQARYWRAVKTGVTQIESGLSQSLNGIRFPAVFLDFEATLPAIPVFVGTRPYETVVFQWSAHILDASGEVTHAEYLSDGSHDPRVESCASLLPILEQAATVVHYSPYEQTQLKSMAEKGITHARECFDLFAAKQVDLEAIIKSTVTHPEFEGKTSIKKVLPVLVPGMDYKDLAIQGGDAAQFAYLRMADPTCPAEERAQIYENLLAYCKRDTEAMVKLYEVLLTL